MKVEPAQARHPDIEDEACGGVRARRVQEVLGGSEGFGAQPDRPDQAAERLAHGRVVVDHEDHGLRRLHAAVRAASGNVNWKVSPAISFALAQSRPPWASTIDRLIARPIPMPSGLVV